ncbi:MAG: TIM-barrel domain-containing protein, partial [Cetobacterium sp.]
MAYNIQKYRKGNPFSTDATTLELKSRKIEELNYFKILNENKYERKILENTIVYGLGEAVGGLNKRGKRYESFCSDEFNQTPEKNSLYGAHNFLLIDEENPIGIFIDTPGKVIFDIGFKDRDVLEIEIENSDYDIYIISGIKKKDIVNGFINLIGESFIPPKWALGFQQCRWSYKTSSEIDELIQKFRNNGIPCDTVYLDIDYMQNYKNFTINKEAFPNFKNW